MIGTLAKPTKEIKMKVTAGLETRTMRLPTPLMRELKMIAAREDTTIRALVEEAATQLVQERQGAK
jgi:predicted DNA-binding ribbon-helix-helix protein